MAITDWFNKPASNAMLDNSFRNQFYQSNVQPVQSGATNVRPTNMAALKNWTPWKAFMPQSMGGTFYTGGTPQALGALNTAKNFGLGALRFSGLTNPVGAAAMSAYAAPKLINALTERDPDATKSSLFGIDLTRNANEQAALPDVGANPWGSPMGDIPVAGDDIQEQVTETETIDPYETDPYGTEHHYVTPDKKRSLPFSGILQGLKNQFKMNPEKQKEFDSWEENKDQTGWGSIGDTGLKGNIYEGPGGKKFSLVDPTTGYNVLQNKNWRGGTGNSLREQINLKNAWIADRLLRGKGLSGKARAYAKLNKLGTYADKETFTPPPGGGPLNEPGGEWVGGAPAYTHQGIGGGEYTNEIGNVEYQDPYDPGGGEAAGGLMRTHSRGRYSKGGRVGILSVF